LVSGASFARVSHFGGGVAFVPLALLVIIIPSGCSVAPHAQVSADALIVRRFQRLAPVQRWGAVLGAGVVAVIILAKPRPSIPPAAITVLSAIIARVHAGSVYAQHLLKFQAQSYPVKTHAVPVTPPTSASGDHVQLAVVSRLSARIARRASTRPAVNVLSVGFAVAVVVQAVAAINFLPAVLPATATIIPRRARRPSATVIISRAART